MFGMSAGRAHITSREEPTPDPASVVERLPESARRGSARKAALVEYFASPSPEMLQTDAAWEEALALYGDEDSDAWVSALEDGTHPLCRVRRSTGEAPTGAPPIRSA